MITKEYYLDDFNFFVWSKKNVDFVKEIDEQINSFEDAFDYLDYQKNIDLSLYNIETSKKQDSIESELRAWKKYYLNNYKKASFRDFKPILTKGEIANFITNQLKTFVDQNTIVGLGEALRLISIDPTQEVALEALSNIVLRQINNRIRRLTGFSGNNITLLRETAKISNMIGKQILDGNKRNLFIGQVRNIMFEQQQSANAKVLFNSLQKLVPKTLRDIVGKRGKNDLVDFFFELMTGDDLSNLSNVSSITSRIKTRWRDFVRKKIFKTDEKLKAEDLFNVAVDVFKEMGSQVLNSKNVFKLRFNDILFRAINKRLSPFEFNSSIRRLIRQSGTELFRNGIELFGLDVGEFSFIELFGLDVGEFSFVERLVVNKLTRVSDKWIDGLTNSVTREAISLAEAMLKVDSWANKTLTRFFQLGRLAADRNGLYEWIFGDTVHCPTCLTANGQIHRLKDWHNSGILPQNTGHKDLVCGGFNCQCRLVRVTGKSRGRLDRIKVA
jgi:hypothetical protein